jgi:hypothetical protein
MHDASTRATLVLERPDGADDLAGRDADCVDVPAPAGRSLPAPAEWSLPTPAGRSEPPSSDGVRTGLGFIVRAPGLVLLATVFLIQGYTWLGVLHVDRSAAASLFTGRAGVALLSLLAPAAAVALTCGRRASGRAVEDLVVGAAVAVTITTVTALVAGGAVWRTAAGSTDLLLAAAAVGAVILGERARLRATEARTGRTSAAA